jgi:recombination protein U
MKERNYTSANRGSYAETLIDRTCQYYRTNHIAMIEKREVPIKILKRINESTIIGRLMSKSFVDYFGCYHVKHFEFEVKQTNDYNFSLDMIKPHQLRYLIECVHYGVESFVVVYFSAYDQFYKVTTIWIME